MGFSFDRWIFRVVCFPGWLHKCISEVQVFENVVRKQHEDGYIESFGLTIRLWMMRCCCQVFNT